MQRQAEQKNQPQLSRQGLTRFLEQQEQQQSASTRSTNAKAMADAMMVQYGKCGSPKRQQRQEERRNLASRVAVRDVTQGVMLRQALTAPWEGIVEQSPPSNERQDKTYDRVFPVSVNTVKPGDNTASSGSLAQFSSSVSFPSLQMKMAETGQRDHGKVKKIAKNSKFVEEAGQERSRKLLMQVRLKQQKRQMQQPQNSGTGNLSQAQSLPLLHQSPIRAQVGQTTNENETNNKFIEIRTRSNMSDF